MILVFVVVVVVNIVIVFIVVIFILIETLEEITLIFLHQQFCN